MNEQEIKIGKIYKHFKNGKLYKVINIARHSETMEDMVIYEPQYESESKLWVRPLKMFAEKVEWPKDSGKKVFRFTLETRK